MKKKFFISVLSWLIIPALLFLCCTDWDLGGEDAPDSVTLGIIGVTDTTVTLRWSKSDDTDFESYMVYYSLSDVVDTTDQIADTIYFSYDTIKTVQGLEPEKHYYFRVIVNTFRNMISASNIVDTTTLKNISSYTLKLSKPVAVSEHSISLSWEKEWTSTYNQYWIYYDTTSTVDSTDICIDTVNNVTTDTIAGLKRETAYWFRVYLNRDGVPKAGSNIDSATTTDGKPKPVTLSVDRQSIIDTAVTLVWSKSPDIDFKRYLVYYDTIPKIDTFTIIDTADTHVTSVNFINDTIYTIKTLQRKKTYWFNIYVKDTSGFITASNVDSATTDEGLPSPVELSIGTVTDTSVVLLWSMNNDSDFYRYAVYYSDTSYGLDTVTVIDTAVSSFFSVITLRSDTGDTVVPLERNKTYYFIVYVEDSFGLLMNSNIKSATTDDGLPEAVELTIDTSSITDISVILQWSESPDYDFKNYSIYFDTEEEVDSLDSLWGDITFQDSTTVLINGLTPYTRYWFKVYVTSNSGQKAGSNAVYNFPVIIYVDSTTTPVTDTTIPLRWTMSFYPDSLFRRYRLYRSSQPNVTDQGQAVIDTIDITADYFVDTTASASPVYYRLFHYAINDEGKVEARKSNEIEVTW